MKWKSWTHGIFDSAEEGSKRWSELLSQFFSWTRKFYPNFTDQKKEKTSTNIEIRSRTRIKQWSQTRKSIFDFEFWITTIRLMYDYTGSTHCIGTGCTSKYLSKQWNRLKLIHIALEGTHIYFTHHQRVDIITSFVVRWITIQTQIHPQLIWIEQTYLVRSLSWIRITNKRRGDNSNMEYPLEIANIFYQTFY